MNIANQTYWTYSVHKHFLFRNKRQLLQESHELDDFIPEQSKENLENLDISIKQKSDRDPGSGILLLYISCSAYNASHYHMSNILELPKNTHIYLLQGLHV